MNLHTAPLKSTCFVAVVAMAMLVAGPVFADVPVSITQQGRLLDSDGDPRTGPTDLLFEIHDSATSDSVLWSDEVNVNLGDNGVYSATLGGESNPIDADLLREGSAYMALTVDGSELEPRLEMNSVPFASIAESAQYAEVAELAESVAEASITAESLASGAVTSDAVDSIGWGQITDVPDEVTETSDTLAELSCGSDDIAIYQGSGTWQCTPVPSYDGGDFALSDQNCSGNQVAAGIDASGSINCIDQQDTTYSGSDFALSNQACSGNQVAAGISSDGSINCIDQQDTTYSAGTGLELSGDEFAADTGYFDDNYYSPGDAFDMGSSNISFDWDLDCSGFVCSTIYGALDFQDARLRGISDEEAIALTSTDDDGEGPALGIGVTNPARELHIKQERASHEAIAIESTGETDGFGIGVYDFTGSLHFRSSTDTTSGDFSGTSWITTDGEYNQSSDRRLKQDIENLDGILGDIMQLRPTEYRFNDADEDSDPTVGFIAQEVEEVFPHLVGYEDGQYALSYGNFAVLAIQAIQEQQELIDERDAEVDELRSEVDELESRLQEIERQL